MQRVSLNKRLVRTLGCEEIYDLMSRCLEEFEADDTSRPNEAG
jgi:hypothetical protein